MIKVQQGERVVVFNPLGRDSGLKPVRFGADLALVSVSLPLANGVEEVTFGDRRPFVVDGPGEYEVAETFIRGFSSSGPEQKINTIYDLIIDGKRLVHLGMLADKELTLAVKEELTPVDILFVGLDQAALPPRLAYQLALSLNPHLIIPVNYSPATLASFLKEAGEDAVQPLDKLTIKGRELLEKEAEVVVLKAD